MSADPEPKPPSITGYVLEGPPLDSEAGATVWKGTHTRTGRAVAVTSFAGQEGLDWLFLRRTVERLIRVEGGHTHVAALLDADLGADPPHYVTELVGGIALAERIGPGQRPSLQQSLEWTSQMAQALSFLHAKGVLHCGLNPSRVRVDQEGRIRITGAGHRVLGGTPSPWAAPEQAAKGEPDVRWDVWALGALAHGLLAGVPPPVDGNLRATLKGLDEDLAAIMGRCLERDPERRYQGVGAILADLKARSEGRPIGPLSDRPVYRLRKVVRRNRVGLGIVALVLVGLGIGGWQALRQAESSRALGSSLLLRAQQAAARGETAAAAIYAARSNAIVPSVSARTNALAFLRGLARPKHTFPHAWATGAAGLITFSPDGQRLAIGEEGGLVRLWRVDDGQLAGEIRGPAENVQHVAFTPDGKLVLVAFHDGSMRFWDSGTLSPAGPVMAHARKILAAAITPDGNLLVTAGEDAVSRAWDVRTGQAVGEPVKQGTAVSFLSMAPDGKLVATAGGMGKDVIIWDPRSAKVVKTLKESQNIHSLGFAPDGRRLLIAISDGSARLVDVATGDRIGNQIHHRIGIIAAAFTNNGGRMITGGWDGVVSVWDAGTGAPLGELGRHANGVSQVRVHPDGRRVLTSSTDGTVRLWDLETGNPAGPVMLHEAAVHHTCFSPDGKLIASAGEDGMARLWETDPPRPDERRESFSGNGLLAAAFAPGGDTVAAVHPDGSIEVMPISAEGPGTGTHFAAGGTPREVGFIEAGGRRLLWAVTWEGAFRCFDPSVGTPAGKAVEAGGLSAWAFSGDAKMLATFGYDFNIRIWKVPDMEPLGPAFVHDGGGPIVTFSPDGGRLFTVGYDGTLKAWKVPGGELTGEPARMEGGPSSLVFSPDGTTALTSCYDGNLRLFNPVSWRRTGEPMAHPLTPSAFMFTPDGKRILSGAFESSVFVWDARRSARVGKSFRLPRAVESIAMIPGGWLGAVATWGGTVQFVDLSSGDPVGPPFPAGPDVRALAFGDRGAWLAAVSATEGVLRLWNLGSINEEPSPSDLLLRAEVLTHRRVTSDLDIEAIPAAEWKEMAARMLDGAAGRP